MTDKATMPLSQAYGGGRVSPQRRTIARVAEGLTRAFTVDELSRSVRERDDDIGVATVYRAVAALEGSGWLARVGERDGSALYARCTRDHHHHHLVCTECGAVTHVDCPLEIVTARHAEEYRGYAITGHEITLYGVCPDCRERNTRGDV